MSQKKIIQYRRKREGRTNYKKRLLLLKSMTPRLIIRRTDKQILLQLAEYAPDGDKLICGTSSNALKKLGWKYSCKNLPAAYLTGMLIARKALAKNIKSAIVDVGLQTPIPGSRLYAAVKGAIDGGLNVPASEEVFPSKERLTGAHISNFFKENKIKTQFTDYKKQSTDPAKITQDIETLKKKIMNS